MKLFTYLLLLSLAARTSFAAPKHIFLMIADGWGHQQVKAADMWSGRLQSYEEFPVRVSMSTYSWSTVESALDDVGYDPSLAWKDFSYLLRRPTESAAAATALATGVKTFDGALNVDPLSLAPLVTVCEVAEKLGFSTGVITSVEWSHATPAGFLAHDLKRGNYAAIAREMIDSTNAEVIIGCGHPYFDGSGDSVVTPEFKYVGGKEMWNALTSGKAGGSQPWKLIQTRREFQELISGTAPARLLGTAQTRSTLQQQRAPAEGKNDPVPPFTVPFNEDVPTLAEMVRAGLNVLDDNPRGFFVMIEGGAVDWACHDNQQGRMIEEMLEFSRAVAAVTEWIETYSNWDESLVVVTGDHECGFLWGEEIFQPVQDRGKGKVPAMKFHSGEHSNSLIPLYAKGAGSALLLTRAMNADSVYGNYLDNTDLGKFLHDILP